MKTNMYLNFDGQTKEAFEFYAKAFGTEPEFHRYDSMPMKGFEIPAGKEGLLMHASLPLGDGEVLMGSDPLPEFGHTVQMGNNAHHSLTLDSRDEADRLFAALSEGGTVLQAMGDMPWGDYWGNFTDKFGVPWMFTVPGQRPA